MLRLEIQDGMQSIFNSAGKWSCYFLCLLRIADIELTKSMGSGSIDLIDTIFTAADKGYIKFNKDDYKDDDNFYILEPAKLLEMLTGDKWTSTWQPASYIPKADEYAIQCYRYNVKTHFRMADFDSLQNSQTVKYGYLESYRILKKVA